MRTDSNQSGRRSRRGSRNYRQGGGSYTPKTPAKPAKQSLWQKIVSFFTGDKKKTTKPQPSYTPRSTTVESRPARKPEAVEVTSPKLYVGNLSFDATESDLTELFNGVGLVKLAEVVSHKATQKSKGFAFITMQSVEEAKRAVETLHDKEFMGRKLVVSGAKTSDVRNAA